MKALLFVCCLLIANTFFSSICVSQQLAVENLSELEDARDRLDKYLVTATGFASNRLVIFRLYESVTMESQKIDDKIYREGLFLNDFKKRVQYSFTMRESASSDLPLRTEMFRLDGKEKARAYGVDGKFSRGRTQEIKPDEVTGERRGGGSLGALFVSHMEVDPFGVVITEPVAINYRYSAIDFVAGAWKSEFKFVDQKRDGKKLVSIWSNNRIKRTAIIVFDDDAGGMPVLYRSFETNKDGSESKKVFSSVETKWVGIDDKWQPVKVEAESRTSELKRGYSASFEYIDARKYKQVVEDLDWQKIFKSDDSFWFEEIALRIFDIAKSKP